MKQKRCPQCGLCYDSETECLVSPSEDEFPGEPNEVFFNHASVSEVPETETPIKKLNKSRCCPQCGAPEDGKSK